MAGATLEVKTKFTASDKVSESLSNIAGAAGKAQSKLAAFGATAASGLNKAQGGMTKISNGFKQAVVPILAVGGAIGFVGKEVISTGADFEEAITGVGAVGLKTRGEIQDLEKMALKLGSTTKFTATEAANAMEVMARAGFTNAEIMAGVPAVLSAAAASGMEIAEVADHVSNALKGMGLEASEAGRVADVLALASSKTNSSIGSLGESLSNVASTAKQLGVPLEDTVASVALLQDVGLDASVAGSALNTMLSKMAAPTAGITAKMKKFGVTFKDAEGNMLPFADVLKNLSEAADKSGGNMDKVAFLAELVGLRGQKAAANLADLFDTGKVEKLTEELANADGAAKKMADLKMDNLKGDFTLLGSLVDGLKVKLFDVQNGPLRALVQTTTEWIEANQDVITGGLTEFLGSLIENLPQIVNTLKNIAIGIAIFKGLQLAISAATFAIGAYNMVQAAAAAITATHSGAVLFLAAKLTFLTIKAALFNAVAMVNPFVWIGLAVVALAGLVVYWDEIVGLIQDAFYWAGKFFGLKDPREDGKKQPQKTPEEMEEMGALEKFSMDFKKKDDAAYFDKIGGQSFDPVNDQSFLGASQGSQFSMSNLTAPPQGIDPALLGTVPSAGTVSMEKVEVLIKDQTGAAEIVSGAPTGKNSSVRVDRSGTP